MVFFLLKKSSLENPKSINLNGVDDGRLLVMGISFEISIFLTIYFISSVICVISVILYWNQASRL